MKIFLTFLLETSLFLLSIDAGDGARSNFCYLNFYSSIVAPSFAQKQVIAVAESVLVMIAQRQFLSTELTQSRSWLFGILSCPHSSVHCGVPFNFFGKSDIVGARDASGRAFYCPTLTDATSHLRAGPNSRFFLNGGNVLWSVCECTLVNAWAV